MIHSCWDTASLQGLEAGVLQPTSGRPVAHALDSIHKTPRRSDSLATSTTAEDAELKLAVFGIAEEDPLLSTLRSMGGEVFYESTPRQFLTLVRKRRFDLLIIGWELNNRLGLRVLGHCRAIGASPPALVVTSRQGESNIVRAFDSGADDCIVRPWRPLEVKARIRALLRFTHSHVAPDGEMIHGFEFRPAALLIKGHGIEVRLPPKEFQLALYFFRNMGKPVSRADLFENLWGNQSTPRTIDQHVVRLRKKLHQINQYGFEIQTLYRFGYIFKHTGNFK